MRSDLSRNCVEMTLLLLSVKFGLHSTSSFLNLKNNKYFFKKKTMTYYDILWLSMNMCSRLWNRFKTILTLLTVNWCLCSLGLPASFFRGKSKTTPGKVPRPLGQGKDPSRRRKHVGLTSSWANIIVKKHNKSTVMKIVINIMYSKYDIRNILLIWQ